MAGLRQKLPLAGSKSNFRLIPETGLNSAIAAYPKYANTVPRALLDQPIGAKRSTVVGMLIREVMRAERLHFPRSGGTLMSDENTWTGPVVDAHAHFWDPIANDHPWLRPDVIIPLRYGDYSAIKRRYLPDDYRKDAAGHAVCETVYVETEWDPNTPLDETRYASGLSARYRLPNAIVGQAWLNRDDAATIIAQQAAFPLVRSIRHKPGGPASPNEVGRTRTLMSDDTWRCGFALLERHGLHFDLQTPWWNLDEAITLARDFPRMLIILNHAGLPADRSPERLAGWRAAMARLAEEPNVRVKISGIGLRNRPWSVDDNCWIVEQIVAMFGASRAMFASNFPVDSLCGSFDTIFSGFKRIAARYSKAEQARLFCETAREVYRTNENARTPSQAS
jgi:predicted TIM-barrel fold metal-dependent hydrolase